MEQLCIVIRYVDLETASIREDRITFLECESGITGKSLADKMLSFIRNHLYPLKIRSQAYDGASNMPGKINGAAARIPSQYPLTIYTHYTAHLNLVIVASFKELKIRNMIGVMKRLSNLLFCTLHMSEEVGRRYTKHLARIKHVEAQRSLQNKMD